MQFESSLRSRNGPWQRQGTVRIQTPMRHLHALKLQDGVQEIWPVNGAKLRCPATSLQALTRQGFMGQPREALHGSPDALVSVPRFWPISTRQHFQALCGGINDRQRGAHLVPEHSKKLDQTLTLIALFLRLKACSISLIFQPLLILKPKHQQQM